MRHFVIDFETVFTRDVTLRKMTIEEYVRHPAADVICMGVWEIDPAQLTGVPFKRDYPLVCDVFWDEADIVQFLETHAADAVFICQHAQFDGAIITWRYGVRPHMWCCTIGLARALHPRLRSYSLAALTDHFALGQPKSVPYGLMCGKTRDAVLDDRSLFSAVAGGCLHDCELTAALFAKLWPHLPAHERTLLDLHIRLFTEPVLCGNPDVLAEAVAAAEDERATACARAGLTPKALRKDQQFAAALIGLGIAPPVKKSPTKGKGDIYAFAKSDRGMLDLLEHEDPQVQALAEARIAAKTSLAETRAYRLLTCALRGPIPVYAKYYGAHTGRASGGDKTNLFNLPRGGLLRKGLEAAPGYVLVIGDASQVECRVLAVLAGQQNLIDAFASGEDVYSTFGNESGIWPGKVISRETKAERTLCKKAVLGFGYGAFPKRFRAVCEAEGVELPEGMEQLLWDGYHNTYPRVRELYGVMRSVLAAMASNNRPWLEALLAKVPALQPSPDSNQKIRLPSGMDLDYTGVEWNQELRSYAIGEQKLRGELLAENACQALGSRILIMDAWRKLAADGFKVCHTVYDDLVLHVRDTPEHIEDARQALEEALTARPWWMPDLPLACEIKVSKSYGG